MIYSHLEYVCTYSRLRLSLYKNILDVDKSSWRTETVWIKYNVLTEGSLQFAHDLVVRDGTSWLVLVDHLLLFIYFLEEQKNISGI